MEGLKREGEEGKKGSGGQSVWLNCMQVGRRPQRGESEISSASLTNFHTKGRKGSQSVYVVHKHSCSDVVLLKTQGRSSVVSLCFFLSKSMASMLMDGNRRLSLYVVIPVELLLIFAHYSRKLWCIVMGFYAINQHKVVNNWEVLEKKYPQFSNLITPHDLTLCLILSFIFRSHLLIISPDSKIWSYLENLLWQIPSLFVVSPA